MVDVGGRENKERGGGERSYVPGCWKYIGGREVRQTLWDWFG